MFTVHNLRFSAERQDPTMKRCKNPKVALSLPLPAPRNKRRLPNRQPTCTTFEREVRSQVRTCTRVSAGTDGRGREVQAVIGRPDREWLFRAHCVWSACLLCAVSEKSLCGMEESIPDNWKVVCERIHPRHEMHWILRFRDDLQDGEQLLCVACVIEMIEGSSISIVRKKYILACFHNVLVRFPQAVVEQLTMDARVCVHFIVTLLGKTELFPELQYQFM
ncbi:hypothetical protein chiPu_0011811 [Chiloscyllium punctatum]|uniref:Uncharacterized protein n=1 Tax=Chiloscyllium punctatum TaxID=137246 RepID=A0A401SSK1_CHIPU|nr:hypothetical protein [Chiloscyllium punctatum]